MFEYGQQESKTSREFNPFVLLSLFLVQKKKEEVIYTLKFLLEEDEEERKVSKILIK